MMAKRKTPAEMRAAVAAMSAASEIHKATTLSPYDGKALEPHEAKSESSLAMPTLGGTPEPSPEPAKAAKKSTSLYLTEDARRALNRLAADKGVRPHRIVDEALRAYFAQHDLDFDKLNGQG